ncbi:MAG: hypothetical protein JWO85_3462 [Candidatus Eremiobacteraeota bacterium]|nr:hypothetical protein [Candidatus Eremiobacteraeota bacterium]
MAASTAWSIQIRMSTSSTAPAMFRRVAAAAEKAGVAVEGADEKLTAYGVSADRAAEQVGVLTAENSALARSFVVAGRSSNAMNGSLLKTPKAASVANKALIGIGVTSAIVFAVGIKGASDLQNATLQSGIALGRMGGSLDQTMTKMNDFTQVAFNMSKITGQSLSDSMGVVMSGATSGLNAAQIKSASTPVAQFGDLLKYGKDKMGYEQSAALGFGLVHDMRLGLSGNDKKNADDTAYGLARIAQLSFMSPHGEAAVTTQIRRFAPVFEGILPGTEKQKADTIVKTAAWVDRLGTLPFAGSALSQLLTQMVDPRSDRVRKSMTDLGVFAPGHMNGKKFVLGKNNFWDDRTGTFDYMGALQGMGKKVADAHAQGLKTGHVGDAVMAVFGNTQNAQRMISSLTSKEAQQAWKNVNAQMSGFGADPVAWMAQAQTQVMDTLSGQVGILISNLTTMSTLLTNKLVPPLTTIANYLQSTVGRFDQALIDHPHMAQMGGIALLVGGIAGILALVKAGHNVIHFFASLGKNPHFGTVISEVPGGGGGVAGRVGVAAADAAKLADLPILLGLLSKAGKALPLLASFGSKLIPVVGELGLLYTALQLMGVGIDWYINFFHLKKSERYGGPAESWRGKRVDTPDAPVGLPAILKGPHVLAPVGHGPWIKSPSISAAGIKDINVPILPSLDPVKPRGRWDKPAPAPPTEVRHSGKITVALTGSSLANMSSKDKNELTDMLSERLAAKVARETAYPFGGTQTVATDNHGGSNYHSSYGRAK